MPEPGVEVVWSALGRAWHKTQYADFGGMILTPEIVAANPPPWR